MSGTPELKTPGEVIGGARRQRGLSVEDLAERTKIPPSMLLAIEADEYHRLSDPLYAKAFLRTCAKELGLAVDDILDLYARHLGETPRPAGESPGVEEVVRIRRVGVPWARLSAGALLVVAVGATVFVLNRRGSDEPAPGPAATAGAGREVAGAEPAGWADGNSPARVAVPPPVDAAAEVPAGVPGLAFSDDLTWPVVVRLRVPGPITARARRDSDEQYGDVVWPDSVPAVPVPTAGIVAGRAYAAGDDLIVYWGAAERLSLVLDIADGIELTVNGEPQMLERPADGGEITLDLRAASPTRLP
jgi:transcriptional regulator with XRE-family HTH domain